MPLSAPVLIALNHVSKGFRSADATVPVLTDVDLIVRAGEAVAIEGVSGSGKSTLLHLLGAIDQADGGTVRICDQDPARMSAAARTGFRATHIGFVFQFFNLIPTLTAAENVSAALEPVGGTRASRAVATRDALAAVGLSALAERYPSQLSGGEQQRVAIARALAKRPPVLLADEPTGALDRRSAEQVLTALDAVRREIGCALVIATHDPSVRPHVDRVLRLDSGRLLPRD